MKPYRWPGYNSYGWRRYVADRLLYRRVYYARLRSGVPCP